MTMKVDSWQAFTPRSGPRSTHLSHHLERSFSHTHPALTLPASDRRLTRVKKGTAHSNFIFCSLQPAVSHHHKHNGNKALTPGLCVVRRLQYAILSRAVCRHQDRAPRFGFSCIRPASRDAVLTSTTRAAFLRLIRGIRRPLPEGSHEPVFRMSEKLS